MLVMLLLLLVMIMMMLLVIIFLSLQRSAPESSDTPKPLKKLALSAVPAILLT